MKCARCFFSDRPVADETCQRCSRNFTRKELLEIIALGVMYLLICRFSAYMFTGDFFNRPLKGGFFFPVDFREIFSFPVSFAEHPVHIFTVGWLFAMVILAPVLTGLFYGATAGLAIAFVGAYHVVVPFFVLLVMLGALIASTRVRNLLHLETSVYLAAVPPLVYLFSISFSAVTAAQGPGIVAWLPWLATVFVIAATVAPVMWHARRCDYKGTFLLWLTGTQAVLIVAVFYGTIGFSKVEYEFVRRGYWSGSTRFRIPLDRNVGESEAERREKALELFNVERQRAIDEFSDFITWFPRAAETPMALYERAELRNMKPCFTGSMPDQLRPYADRITLKALDEDYRRIIDSFGDTVPAVEARLKEARYYMQHTMLAPARLKLKDTVELLEIEVVAYRPGTDQPLGRPWREHRLDRLQRLHLMYEVLQEARVDRALLENNADYNDLPLMLYCQLDPRDPGYVDGLGQILKWFPDSKLVDNIRLALVERGRYSPETLEALLTEYPKGDVAPRILLLLGKLYRQRGEEQLARQRIERLLAEFPDALERHEAEELLAAKDVEKREGDAS